MADSADGSAASSGLSQPDEPVWLTGPVLMQLLDACRRDHRSPLVDVDQSVLQFVLAACRQRYAGGDADLGRLGGEYFVRIMAEPSFGPGRPLLALIATLVFWALNGYEMDIPPGSLVLLARRVSRTGCAKARVAALFRQRGRRAGNAVAGAGGISETLAPKPADGPDK